MAYTVKQVAAMSGVSVRTLHFYDETALLKPAYTKANGYRFYEEPQLLILSRSPSCSLSPPTANRCNPATNSRLLISP